MSHIIFNGPPGSGKDEACHFLKTNYGYKHLEIKQQLFVDTVEYYGVDLDWFMSNYNTRLEKERARPELGGISKREALIHVSENIMKPKYGKDYYGYKTAEAMDCVSRYCLSDGGFVEEVLPIINNVGQDNICIVQLYRNGCSFSSDSRNYIYGNLVERFGFPWYIDQKSLCQTEPQIPIRMYEIHNEASVSDFHQIIRKILRKEANATTKISDLSRKSV